MVGYKSRQSDYFCLFASGNGCEHGFIMPNFRGEKVNAETVLYKAWGGET